MMVSSPQTAMTGLIKRLLKTLQHSSARRQPIATPEYLDQYISEMAVRGISKESMVMASDTAVELGSPECLSLNAVLWTHQEGWVTDDQMWLLGKDLPDARPQNDYAQFILVQIHEGIEPDPFQLESAQFLIRRLPGIMSRTVPGKLWIRISDCAMAQAIDFSVVACALRQSCKQNLSGIAAVESVFINDERSVIQNLSGLASEARIIAGRHKKVSLGMDGEYECAVLDCDVCENQHVCDQIRKVATIRKQKPTPLQRKRAI